MRVNYLLLIHLFLVMVAITCELLFFPFLPAQASEEGGERLTTLGRGEARFIIKTSDGGYAVTGWIESKESTAIFLAKCDAEGRLLWQQEFYGNGYSCGYGVVELREGGFVVVGDTKSRQGYDHDVYVVRTDEKGQVIWEKNLGGPFCDYAWSVRQTKKGDLILAGGTESYGAGQYDVYLLKLSLEGEKLWEKTYGGSASDVGYALLEIPDGYLVVGNTASLSSGSTDVYLLCLNEQGELLWQKTYGHGGAEYGWSLIETSDGGYMLAGEKEVTEQRGAYLSPYLLKVDAGGHLLWEKTYEGQPGTIYHVSRADNVYVLTGKRENQEGYYDLWVAEVNEKGDLLREKAFHLNGSSCGYSLWAEGNKVIIVGRGQKAPDNTSEALLWSIKVKRGYPLLALALGGALFSVLLFLMFKRLKFRQK